MDNGQWAYGVYGSHTSLDAMIIDRPYTASDGDIAAIGFWTVDPATVGQCTGLTDKNGVKIFEGDIIRGEGSKAKTDNFVVRWSEPCCGFSAGEGKRTWPNLNQATINGYEVIGNINDNPELLEKKT